MVMLILVVVKRTAERAVLSHGPCRESTARLLHTPNISTQARTCAHLKLYCTCGRSAPRHLVGGVGNSTGSKYCGAVRHKRKTKRLYAHMSRLVTARRNPTRGHPKERVGPRAADAARAQWTRVPMRYALNPIGMSSRTRAATEGLRVRPSHAHCTSVRRRCGAAAHDMAVGTPKPKQP